MSAQINIFEYPEEGFPSILAEYRYRVAVMEAHHAGYRIQYVSLDEPGVRTWRNVTGPMWEWHNTIYRAELPGRLSGHNPANLTDIQVGVAAGWRLLSADEAALMVSGETRLGELVQVFTGDPNKPWIDPGHPDGKGCFFQDSQTFRTALAPGHFIRYGTAPGHNPAALTGEKVGEAPWRLLTSEEVRAWADHPIPGTQYWMGAEWSKTATWSVASLTPGGRTLRTQLEPGSYSKRVQPWTRHTIPMGHVLLRKKDEVYRIYLVVGWDRGSVTVVDCASSGNTFNHGFMFNYCDVSVDGGKTWGLCGSPVEV